MASNPLQNPSLPSLPQHQQNDTGLTSALASRYHAHLPIASLSSQGIVAINTCTDASLGVDGGKEGSAHQAAEDLSLEPTRVLDIVLRTRPSSFLASPALERRLSVDIC